MGVGQYGLKIFKYGFQLRSDGRKRWRIPNTSVVTIMSPKKVQKRGAIRGWSLHSARRLKFKTANADVQFESIITLTYRARTESWETVGDRNKRIVEQSVEDRHRFLRCLRSEMGEYVWVREFQQRGVLHYHVLCEKKIAEARATEVWCRASGQMHDSEVLRHGVKVDLTQSQDGVRRYLGQYLGKEKQKELPVGVDGAGRWWGNSRSLQLAFIDEAVWMDLKDGFRRPNQLRMVRILRQFISKQFRWNYRGGAITDFGGVLSAKLGAVLAQLRAHYGDSPSFEDVFGDWTPESPPCKKPWRWWENAVPPGEQMPYREPPVSRKAKAPEVLQEELWDKFGKFVWGMD